MTRAATPFAFLSVLFTGAIFGFFYAWVCSTMWGLDQLPPNAAIDAMNAMNISVRNGVFMPSFMGTPVVLLSTAVVTMIAGARKSALFFALAFALYIVGAFVPTAVVNVPMNEELKLVVTPLPEAEAQAIWGAYSPRWQLYNTARTIVSGVCLMLAAFGLYSLQRGKANA